MSHPLPEMLGGTMDKLHLLADANTIVGDPITTPDGVTIIPVSKVSFGYAGGGADFTTKSTGDKPNPFGGGQGGGVNITPVAFLVAKEGNVRVLPIAEPASSALDRAIEMLPDLIDKVTEMIKNRKNKDGEAEESEEAIGTEE